MTFPRVSLGIAGVLWLALGLGFLVNPAALAEIVRIEAKGAGGLVEIRAMYGGLGLGLGAFFLISIARIRWTRAALGVQMLTFAGMAGARMIGMVVDGPDRLMAGFAAVELAGAALGLAAFRQAGALFMASRADLERIAR